MDSMVKTATLSSFIWYAMVVAFVGFVMGLWFGCLGGWLMCRIVRIVRIVSYRMFTLFFFLCFASGCYHRVCVNRVLIVQRLRWQICSSFSSTVIDLQGIFVYSSSREPFACFQLICYLSPMKWVKDRILSILPAAFFPTVRDDELHGVTQRNVYGFIVHRYSEKNRERERERGVGRGKTIGRESGKRNRDRPKTRWDEFVMLRSFFGLSQWPFSA